MVPKRRQERTGEYSDGLSAQDSPNAVWGTDFKGWFRLSTGAKCYPLTEEGKLAQLEAERATLADQQPKIMPHPALIARYVDNLLTTLDTDVPKARAILMRVLRPFALTPDGQSYRISGALNLSAVVGPGVSEKCCSGGPLRVP